MAANALSPPDGKYLEPAEIIRRLQQEFQYVTLDKEHGREHVLGQIEVLREWKERSVATDYDIDSEIQNLQSVADDAVYVYFADESCPEYAYLRTLILSKCDLFFGYNSGQHQDFAYPLLKRCAKILGYEIGE